MPKKPEKPRRHSTPFAKKAPHRPYTKPVVEKQDEALEPMRLNKYIASSGICSRRKAVDLIKNGEVTVNGVVVTEPYALVSQEDRVTWDRKDLKPELKKVYILLNKPKDFITTLSDEMGRKTVMDIVGKTVKERIYPVGRLDRDTTGLLLLTNDGDLAKKLSHPSHKVRKIYYVTLDKPLAKLHIEQIANGIELEDGFTKVDGIEYLEGKTKHDVQVILHVGKNRIVRRIFEQLGYRVMKLDRVYYAGLDKKDLPRGHYRMLTEREIIMLKHFT